MDRGDFIIEPERIYAVDGNGDVIAEVTYPEMDGAMHNIDHTFVDPRLRGRGVASLLVQMAVEEIEAKGARPIATCSYAKEWMKRHPRA